MDVEASVGVNGRQLQLGRRYETEGWKRRSRPGADVAADAADADAEVMMMKREELVNRRKHRRRGRTTDQLEQSQGTDEAREEG
ncbi:hypothetical protein Dda_6866 [Drechslerella dactyloides]|uniref:Uncharacterized protein n=1 Tax=Drechslerella dactyloides TaxID=74499 RepID=A0AAD6IUY3_DREDA|nr:hypothetical protein Dda_6866 [Drechslerella dactyloides]